MKTAIFAFSIFLARPASAQDSIPFSEFFVDSTLRIDYYHGGSKAEESITLDRLYRQGVWAGSTHHLLDPFNSGRYAARMYDVATGRLIFSRSYDSYFGEYRTTDPAKKGIRRTYHESVLVPFPRRPVRVEFEHRDRRNVYHPLFFMSGRSGGLPYHHRVPFAARQRLRGVRERLTA